MPLTLSGQLSLLRVHERGSGFGPSSDFIDVEVVVVDSTTGAAGMTAATSEPAATFVPPWLAHPAPKSTSSTAAAATRRVSMV